MQASVSVVGTLARTVALKPGEAFEGDIVLKNSDRTQAELHVSQTDYLFDATGRNQYGAPGQNPRSNAGWMIITPSRLRLGPGETQTVHYKGRAPADAKLRGSYWSMIMVAPETAPAITPDGKPDQIAVGVSCVVRVGVQIVTNLGHDAPRSLAIVKKSLAREADRRILQLDVANDGEQLLIPTVTVELFDRKGVSLGRFEAGRARVYPGCSIRAEADLSRVSPGHYTAMVLLDTGDADVMGAQYDLEIQE